MISNVYAVRDVKADAFVSPFFRRTHKEAMRYFGDAVVSKDTMFHAHPEDFQLFCLGQFDDETGLLVGLTQTQFLVSATEFIPIVREQESVVGGVS